MPRRPIRKPLDEEIDVFGLTHPGKRRPSNQDHFLVCSLRKQMDVHLASLETTERLLAGQTERLALLAMVADGVGGSHAGGEASRLAVEAVTRYVSESIHVYYTSDPADDREFVQTLRDAALRSHADLRQARERTGMGSMATTLTLWIGVWPRAYVLQVGDSRYYLLRGEELVQVSKDQTVAQALVDEGALSSTAAHRMPWADVLSSSLGGSESTPVVTSVGQGWGYVHLLCTDGLTKHVSNERIRERLLGMRSAEQVCRDLLEDALEGGGTDNITLIVGRAVARQAR
ncbi:MAG: protein phosphatase 2C domain-containing protein [Gemmatimonadota bacterium]